MKIKRIIALFLAAVIMALSLVSCSDEKLPDYSVYLKERDVTGRDISYVEISFKKYGKVVVLLDATTAPITVENFLKLVNQGFYDGLPMHRIIKDFMIQGGDPKGNGSGGSSETIKGEFSTNGYDNDILHYKGTISMARGNGNDSASSQFFICNADSNEALDGKYAAFGYVVDGLHVVDEITKKVFPKTLYSEYHGDEQYYNVGGYVLSGHQIWYYYGNGAVEKEADKPIIEYIRVLENYNPQK